MKKYKHFPSFFLSIVILSSVSIIADEPTLTVVSMQKDHIPEYLYKVLSSEDWKSSQSLDFILLPKEDEEFIHFSLEDQLGRIAEKHWSNVPEYVVLKIETNQLFGRLVYEANPGGTNKYYHLYGGSIPLKAVVEVKIYKSKK